jgi:hypothetical protein
MVWARILANITGTVIQELLFRNEYLAAENPHFGKQKSSAARCFPREKGATLAEIACRLRQPPLMPPLGFYSSLSAIIGGRELAAGTGLEIPFPGAEIGIAVCLGADAACTRAFAARVASSICPGLRRNSTPVLGEPCTSIIAFHRQPESPNRFNSVYGTIHKSVHRSLSVAGVQ